MKDKYYGLTQSPNEGVKDKAPDWMDDLFKSGALEQKREKKKHPFEGIDDPILNPQRVGLKDK